MVRLVYDGPPQAGKTTSLRALAGSLSQPHLSLEEAEGRTLYFDWMEYTGGNFEGMPIRCQILSVPGQQALAHRREALLSSADAVIFVADTTEAGVAETVASLRSLHAFLGSRPGPRPGLIVQANKRDQPDALPLGTFRAHLDGDGMAFVESVAKDGSGIREAFVLAVRLALDRVRERLASGDPALDTAGFETPEDLLARLKAADAELPPVESPPAAAEPEPAGPPCLPAADVPSGRVWPPVTGRLVLSEVQTETAMPRQSPDGSWRAVVDGCFFHSAAEHHFRQLDAGRQELLRWARLHSNALDRLAPRRCVVLAETGQGSWRLWQAVHREPSSRQRLWTVLCGPDPVAAGEALLAFAADLLRARESMAQEPQLPCRLELLGRGDSSLLYIGILPPPSWTPPEGEFGADATALLARELSPLLQKGLAESRIDVPRMLDALREARDPTGAHLRETLSSLLAGAVPQP